MAFSGMSPRRSRLRGPNEITIHLESRLPITLRRGRFELERGLWREQPPIEVGAYSVASWVSVPTGFLGRNGVKGSVRYCCDWAGSVAMLHIAFECLLFGERRVVCREETPEGYNCRSEERILCIHCQAAESGAVSISRLHVVVELQEHIARHVSVDKHRIKSVSAAENLRGGRLATVLRQATRSCLVRITNLTQHRLAMDGRGLLDAQGFWVAEPSACIDPHSFCDLGIVNQGLQLSTRGSLCYVVETPENNRDRRVQIVIDWDVPWLRQRNLQVRESGDILAVKIFADRQVNLVGLVHIVDPRCLPTLEVLDAVALASNTGNGEDVTELVQEISKQHELVIPSVRVLLGQAKRRVLNAASNVNEESTDQVRDPYTGLQISYRIGPEVFRRVYSPSERVHLSTAQPGGDGAEDTVLAALEARGPELEVEEQTTLSPAEQALLLQRHLAEGLMPLVGKAFKSIPQGDQPGTAHFWPADGGAPDGAENVLDAQGILHVLRHSWPQVASRRFAGLKDEPVDHLLSPLEDLCSAWANQAEMEPALVAEAATCGGKLCRLFGLEEAAAAMEQVAGCRQARQARQKVAKS